MTFESTCSTKKEVLSDVDGTITRTGVVSSGVIGSGVGSSVTDKYCVCGTKETEIHVLLECKCYDLSRRRWMRIWDVLDEKERTINVIKGYVDVNDDVENEAMKYLVEVWTERQRNERNRVNVIP